jgi:hypothetical protein
MFFGVGMITEGVECGEERAARFKTSFYYKGYRL